jgi:hypothetical protein
VRVERNLLRHLPYAKLSEVGHAEFFIPENSAPASFTRSYFRNPTMGQLKIRLSDNRTTEKRAIGHGHRKTGY